MNTIITAENVSRFYGLFLGLNNVSFTIQPGITGVVGPNGAGKTTLFRLLTGQIKQDAGRLEVFGQSPWNNPLIQARLAYCPESEAVPPGLKPLEWLVALGMISGLSSAEADKRGRTLLDRVKLGSQHWGKRLTAHSKGMKQRVKLAQCLMHDPKLIILDEPMNGLDPMGREDFSVVLRELAKEGVSILISSHILHDLEALCSDFVLLRWGRITRPAEDAETANDRKHWPSSTTFRCNKPDQLARFFFEKRLIRGFEMGSEPGTLHVQWQDAAAFYGDFNRLLLESGVELFEVRATATFLEKIVGPTASP